FLGLSEYPGPDQVKNHVAHIFAGMDAPAIENRHHHRPEFLDGVLPRTNEQFRPGHMTYAEAFDFLLLLGRKIERIAQKNIRVPLVTWVAANNRVESLGETNLLHQQKNARPNALLNIITKSKGSNCGQSN